MKKTLFKECSIKEANFAETDLSGAVFSKCDLSRTTFQQSDLSGVNFLTAINYSIDPEINNIKKARFSADGVLGLLDKYDIIIE